MKGKIILDRTELETILEREVCGQFCGSFVITKLETYRLDIYNELIIEFEPTPLPNPLYQSPEPETSSLTTEDSSSSSDDDIPL